MKISIKTIERKVEQAERAWANTCPEQTFNDMALEQHREGLKPYYEAKANFAAAEIAWDNARQARNIAYRLALELTAKLVNSVKGHPKFGENSSLYSAMGYTPKSDRSSGLTRRRDAVEASKKPEDEEEPAEVE